MSIFTKEMANFIATSISDDYDSFFPNTKTAEYSRKSQSAWKDLTEQLNANFGSSVTETQVREKWHNMKKEAKKKFAGEKKYMKGTGGGPPAMQARDSAHEIIINTFGGTAAFKGVPGGQSTSIFDSTSTSTSAHSEQPANFDNTFSVVPLKSPAALSSEHQESADIEESVKPFGKRRHDSSSHSLSSTSMRASTLAELQRQVLEQENEKNQKAMQTLEKIDKGLDEGVTPVLKKMNAYYDYKIAKIMQEKEEDKNE